VSLSSLNTQLCLLRSFGMMGILCRPCCLRRLIGVVLYLCQAILEIGYGLVHRLALRHELMQLFLLSLHSLLQTFLRFFASGRQHATF